MDFELSFFEYYHKEIKLLATTLLEQGVSQDTVKDVVSSGFYMRHKEGPILDSYYAPNWAFQGQFSLKEFIKVLNGESIWKPPAPKVSIVRSVHDILNLLRSDPHSNHCLEQGSLSFRGQKEEHHTRRAVPNFYMADEGGNERLIIPSIYRKYKDNFQSRVMDEKPHQVFNTVLSDDLIYYGMESPNIIAQRNRQKYGVHTLSDLADFPEPENKEYYKRWSQIKVQGSHYPDIAIISQHYGFHTYGLDITFDPKVAAFFATHSFTQPGDGKADYNPIKNGDHKGVIYCFYFRAPQVTNTRDIIKSVPAFEYIFPLRPIRQSCGLPFFLPDRFNEANQFIWHIFKLHSDFDTDDLPSKTFLFPSQEEDKFYKAAMEVKQKNSNWSDFVEYDFN